jgi:hypothetical protein
MMFLWSVAHLGKQNGNDSEKGKAIPATGDSQMAVSLSAMRAGRTFTPSKVPDTHFC